MVCVKILDDVRSMSERTRNERLVRACVSKMYRYEHKRVWRLGSHWVKWQAHETVPTVLGNRTGGETTRGPTPPRRRNSGLVERVEACVSVSMMSERLETAETRGG